jgi:predicted MFS family arabinose efflux permease
VQALSWEWIFLINVPIGVGVLAMGLRTIPAVERGHGAIDVTGAVTVTAGLVALVYAIISAGDHGWGSSTTLGFGALGLVLLGVFLAVEQRAKHPLVRLSIFRQRSLAVGDLVILLLMSGNIAFFFFSSLYLQDTLGYGPLTTGLAFLPITIGIILASGVAQQIVRRIGVRAMAAIGLAIAAAGEIWLVALPADANYWTDLFLPFIPMSVGIGLAFVALTMLATAGVSAEEAGLASGVYNTAQQVGGALGLAIVASVAAGADSEMGGYHIAFGASGIMLAAGAVLIVTLLRPRHVADVGEVGIEAMAA